MIRTRLERLFRLEATCEAAHGDDPVSGLWCHRPTIEFGRGCRNPAELAMESEDGLAVVLARFAELAPAYIPRWQTYRGRTRQVFKARNR